ncbi:neuraminidase-like domain-containing protein [Flavobacterium sp.]|uniref:Tc toxin subunit A-related protein n=1 Tax=Flavobacterium sp. TaxID=239 RepID=UPI00326651E5
MPVFKLPQDFKADSKTHIANLHTVLNKLKIPVAETAVAEKKMDSTTIDAIKKIQKEFKLPANGKLDEKTLSTVNLKLHDTYITDNKYRTANLHLIFDKLNIEVNPEEKQKRISGETTRNAIKAFQKKEGLPVDGRLSEEVITKMQDRVVANKFYSPAKNQRGVLHKMLLKVNDISKLDIQIDEKEIRSKELGDTSVKVIRAFQEKYRLHPTGIVDKATLDKMQSVTTSRGVFVKKIKAAPVDQLKTVTKELRLNTTSAKVAELQKNLSFLGFKIAEKEFKTQLFGKTTTRALKSLQKEKGIAITGHYDKATIKIINDKVLAANPKAVSTHRYRIKGSVRNSLWDRKNDMVIKVFELQLDVESAKPIAAKKVFLNGFFDIVYDAPINTINGKTDNFHIVVKLYTNADQVNPVGIQKHYNVNVIHWVNFTESIDENGKSNYNGKYLGISAYEATAAFLTKAIQGKPISILKETDSDKMISQISRQTGINTDEIMRQVLSNLVAESVNIPELSAELFYTFIAQNLPPDLPGDLLRGSSNWETIAQLTELTASGIAFLDDSVQIQAIENAVLQNLVTQQIKLKKDQIIESLEKLKIHFTLEKPILIGNGNLKTLLQTSTIAAKNYDLVAKTFVNNKGINNDFWTEIKMFDTQIGATAINDFVTTVEAANISKNHTPTFQFLKENTGSGKKFNQISDVAKLDQNGIISLINDNGKKIPDNMPGDTVKEKIENFAAAIKSRSEFLYPAVSLLATTKRLNQNAIPNIDQVEKFIDEQKELDFTGQNLDKYINDKGLSIDKITRDSIKVVQRIHKLTNNSAAGSVLIDQKLHSSMQIYFMGKERITNMMSAKGVDDKQIFRLYEASKMQYMTILARITDFRKEFYKDLPAAIIPHTYTAPEIQAALGIPDLEILFGSLDFCECDHCKSLYGPAAYLTDMLRFLKEHSATNPSKTVKDILFDRRPDLGNIKLNCANTDTPLPYIDLVNEILENNLIGNKNFIYQTTLSQKELRATPENIQIGAYKKIAGEDFPMTNSFNLWQEEARTYLNYLRVPRFELMEVTQNKVNPAAKNPDDTAIAAEFFNLSWNDKDIITTTRATAAKQNKYWGLDTSQSKVNVSLFMKRSKLSYYEVLELLMVRFVNNPGASKSTIERTLDTCDTAQQTINKMTLAKFDLMNRFIRLWRKSGWKMWELDLFLRNAKIGKSKIDDAALVQLKLVKQLQDKLKLNTETILAFYGDINREIRITPEKQDVIIQPQYNTLFQNIAVTNPIDIKFKAIGNLTDKMQPVDASLPFNFINLDNSILFISPVPAPYTPVPTILSALALNQKDFDAIVSKTNNKLSIASLSVLFRYVYLAKGLKISVSDLVSFLGITNVTDPFLDPETTMASIDNLMKIKSSGLSLLELDYILNYKPDSSVGLREESTAQLIDGLRRILEDSRIKISFLNTLKAFNADDLAPLNGIPFMNLFSPIQSLLIGSKVDLSGNNSSPDEIKFITDFSKSKLLLPDATPNPDAAANKTALIANIKKAQLSATELLANAIIQKQNQIKSHIASSFSITTEQANVLLTNIKIDASANLISKLENENLIALSGSGTYEDITRVNFEEHFKIYTLLHKSAILVSKLKLDTENLNYFITNYAALKTINFSILPVSAVVAPNQFNEWLNLYLFLNFKSKFPEPENISIRSILNLAKDPTKSNALIKKEISGLTKWDDGDPETKNLSSFETGLGIRHTAANLDYTNALTYNRLSECFHQMKLIGTDAKTMLSWRIIGDNTVSDALVAEQTRKAIKSKYEQDDWLSKITPLHDDIREKRRKALVDYHIEYSQRTSGNLTFGSATMINPNWEDSNSLFKYFLIDVEMTSCQLTSRIKQALSSVQFFVQRCFLNLENKYVIVTQNEKEDVSSPNAWSQWKWMKNYRLWEANRKIFFYPENWLEPELRDDKSPFFKDLENDLMQNEATKENVENAFLNYLHKVDEVSHLEVCGLYHQMEDLNPDEVGYETNIVHVIGRTKAMPGMYYYRTYDMNYSTWSSWDKIEVDITGDHVVPVVYNRRLHLFWLQFMDKPMKVKKVPAAQPSNGPTDTPEPLKVLEIQLGWCIKKTGGWTTKKISKQKLIHPWERPHFSYNLKPYYLSKFNELYLDIYLSTSKEFNNTAFYDPNKSYNPTSDSPTTLNPTRLTKNDFNETLMPWHSSSFIFNGEIKDIKLKGLLGSYTDASGKLIAGIDSYDYVNQNFSSEGNAIKELEPLEFGPRLHLPTGMRFNNNVLTNNSTNNSNLGILEAAQPINLLTKASSPFQLVISQQDLQLDMMYQNHPVFYQDNQRAFFVKPEWETRLNSYGHIVSKNRKYRFLPFYHPYTMLFIREFNRGGIDGLLNRKIQTQPQNFSPKNTFNFSSYGPGSSTLTDSSAQTDKVDFSFGGAYSVYNWELFFHAPLMVACKLMQNQKFEEAMSWFHYIFNPTNIEGTASPQRYWITKPFHEYNSAEYRKQRIESILSNLNLNENSEQLKAWRNNPFSPHVIARYRPVAYQKNVVMKYLDNLIAWGDMLFKRDTIESINEASLLYMLAYEILGDRPQKVPTVKHQEFTFNELEGKLDEYGNARVDVIIEDTLLPIKVVQSQSGSPSIPKIDMFYFCIPNNEFITKYWDLVEDRLYKIRHCMNISGIVRQLPLFEPPIDPAILVKAAAAGIDLNSVLNDLVAPTPYYRFRVVVQKAIDICNDVRILGEKLLVVLEKKDSEELSLIRSQQEIQLLESVTEIRKKQIDEAVESIGSLNKSKESSEQKKIYYESIPRMNDWETGGVIAHGVGIVAEVVSTVSHAIAAGASAVPQFKAGASGFGGSPTMTLEVGGEQVSNVAAQIAAISSGIGTISHSIGSLLEAQGGYTRRDQENKQQALLSEKEIDQIQFQINSAEIRQEIAEKELENHEIQIDNSKVIDDYMRNKYTNQQLYNWTVTQISTVYFQAYQLAFDMAKKAEKCFAYELGITDSNIVQFGYWDSLKKGLLSGDKLINDLRRLEAEYINQNKREFEITKHISLAQIAPLALLTLKQTGICTVILPEWIFDMDYPGHYMRRIKNVSISLPCIVGPYTSVNCTLSLLRNETRMDATNGGTYAKVDENDLRFKTMFGSISSIATSHAQNDNGMFELNFNDDRYLPFEGAGVISDWQISLPKENNYFDFDSLSDAIIHINYTSRNGGGQLAAGANADLQDRLPNETAKLFSLKHEFATEWYKFLNPLNGADQELIFTLKPEHFPFFIRNKLNTIQIKKIDIFVATKDESITNYVSNIKVTSGAVINTIPIDPDLNFDGIPHTSRNLSVNALGNVSLKIKTVAATDFKNLTEDEIDDVYVVFKLGI